MFIYEKKLQYPVKIKNPNPKLASLIISQYGGPYTNELQKEPAFAGSFCSSFLAVHPFFDKTGIPFSLSLSTGIARL